MTKNVYNMGSSFQENGWQIVLTVLEFRLNRLALLRRKTTGMVYMFKLRVFLAPLGRSRLRKKPGAEPEPEAGQRTDAHLTDP